MHGGAGLRCTGGLYPDAFSLNETEDDENGSSDTEKEDE